MPTLDDHHLQFKPNTTVAAIVHHKGKFLMVEEWQDQQWVYNQPAGHIEANETIIEGLERELKEETGLQLTAQALSGIYYFHLPRSNLFYLRFCFIVELDAWLETQPEDNEINRAVWMSYEEIVNKSAQLRSPIVLAAIKDYLDGNKYPLSILKSYL
ncbi:NUDIX hydrolase [Thalassotalea mangrovi]|uniref:Phosphatase NudJ n=1 Tax=Thalassotalea mangrovi TaxID=2572245 RepID=A0A4U1B2G9_9GAMM|nr:NUDIX hydrolase [Thalassotalea mangrovi]TKB43752.1 NUDIX hydrolase [Thalassotalea mangrovi]